MSKAPRPRDACLALALLALAACHRSPDTGAGTAVTPPKPAVAAPATAPGPVRAAPADASADAGFNALDASVLAVDDTLERLRARHGAANAASGQVPGAEGEELEGWILFPADPARRLYVYLDDARTHPVAARVLDPESRWQRADGVRTGMTLAQLAQRNGAPVKFTGFDWDYGGTITDWNGGRLARDPPLGGVTLCPPPVDDADAPGYPSGDAEFDSGNAWVVAHPPVVCAFTLDL